jgi:hypothetical protein
MMFWPLKSPTATYACQENTVPNFTKCQRRKPMRRLAVLSSSAALIDPVESHDKAPLEMDRACGAVRSGGDR